MKGTPGPVRLWFWRNFNAYVGPIPMPIWLYDLVPDPIHRLAARLEEKFTRDKDGQ